MKTTDLANFLISLGNKQNRKLTKSRLQRILYLIEKDYFQTTNKKLFKEDFKISKFGPYLLSIYLAFKDFQDILSVPYREGVWSYSIYSVGKDPYLDKSIFLVWSICLDLSDEELYKWVNK